MIDNIMNDYGYHESGVDNTLMNNVLNEDNTVGLGKNTTSKTEGSWPFDQTNHSNGTTPMGTLDIMSFYKKEPTPPTPTGDYLYFEAVEANSTVGMMSTMATAPNLEYSTDGETWQEWQHTTADGAHTFDTITLTAIGDKVYFRGDNPEGLGVMPEGAEIPLFSHFEMTGKIAAGGNIMSLLDKDMETTEIPAFGFVLLFGDATIENPNTSLTAAAAMPAVTTIGAGGCASMYVGCTSLTAAAAMPAVTTIGAGGCASMYVECTFNMSNDGTTLNFDFPTPPITAGETTYNTYYDIAQWMGNTNGFTNP